MLTVERASPDEFIRALSLMEENEARDEIPSLPWDQEWAENNYQDKDNYSIFRDSRWIGFLSLELLHDALFVHTLQLTSEAKGNIWGFRVYEWILAKAKSLGVRRIECNVVKDSSASAMYLRLGFELVNSDNYLSKMQLTFDY